jgi:LCP family protein required for cell wall assembly
MGDDTRKGQGPKIGGETPGLSDTTILLHVSANRKFAYGVSLPRDAMVQRPACTTGSGATDPGGLTQFNAAYAIGGPGCTVKTVESLTGVHIDHFVVVKFRAFRGMVDAIGGVTVCVPQAINDNIGHINLPAGTYPVTGEQALDYVRVRHGIGNGDDIGRMKRQQAFIAAMINKVVSAGTLANPIKIYNFLNAATKGITTDPDFAHLSQLASLGSSLKSIGLDHISFVTVPWEPYPQDINRVQWKPEAKQLWHQIKFDKPLGSGFDTSVVTAANTPGAKKTASPSPSPSASSASPGAPSSSPTPTTQAQQDANKANGLCS